MVNDDKENNNEEERMKAEEMEELFRLFRQIVNEMFVAYDYRKNYETIFRKLQTERALAEKEIDLFSEVGFEWDNEWQEGMR